MGRPAVNITADTNLLVRALTGDDPRQSGLAKAELVRADNVALTLTALCEVVWVLGRGYKFPRSQVAEAIGVLLNAENVVFDRPAVGAGLAMLAAGGDFVDGVIAHEGRWLGAAEFVSFDEAAVAALRAQGRAARVPA